MNASAIAQLKGYPRKSFKKGDNIIAQDTPATHIYYLSSGFCTRNTYTEKGDEIVYDMRSADNSVYCLLGALALYHPNAMHTTNFTAKSNCICYQIPKNDFYNFLSDYPAILHELLYMALNRYTSLDQNFQAKQKRRTANRVCSFIAENLYEKDQAFFLKSQFTNAEIGRYIGVHRITIVKIMRQLMLEGIIEKTDGKICVTDLEALLAYARDEKILPYTTSAQAKCRAEHSTPPTKD